MVSSGAHDGTGSLLRLYIETQVRIKQVQQREHKGGGRVHASHQLQHQQELHHLHEQRGQHASSGNPLRP